MPKKVANQNKLQKLVPSKESLTVMMLMGMMMMMTMTMTKKMRCTELSPWPEAARANLLLAHIVKIIVIIIIITILIGIIIVMDMEICSQICFSLNPMCLPTSLDVPVKLVSTLSNAFTVKIVSRGH